MYIVQILKNWFQKKRKKGTQREDDESRFIININEMRCEKDMSSNDKS